MKSGAISVLPFLVAKYCISLAHAKCPIFIWYYTDSIEISMPQFWMSPWWLWVTRTLSPRRLLIGYACICLFFLFIILSRTSRATLNKNDNRGHFALLWLENVMFLKVYSMYRPSWKDWCWSWCSNTLATWFKELTHWKRPWCWEGLRAKEVGDRGWDGWMASQTQWTWLWASSGR